MKQFLIGLFLSLAIPAFAQPIPPIVQSGSITPGHIAVWTTNGVIQDGGASLTPGLVVGTTPVTGGTTGNCLTINVGILSQASCGSGGGGITIGSTTIAGGTTGRILYDNSGIAGELATTGSGNAVLATAPSLSGLTVTGSFTATGLVTNADLANASTTVNGVTCTLGSTCAPSIVSLANGITLTGGVNGGVLSQSGTTLAISTTLPGGLTLPSVVLTGSPSGAGANMTINGTSCLLGSSCTISAGIITIGTTQIANDTINAVLIVGAGHLLSETNVANNSVLVTSAGGVPSLSTTLPSGLAATNMALTTPTLGVATATSLTVSGTLNAAGTFQIGGTAVALPISLTNGGTAAALTASNGGIIYSTASAFAVLAGTATPSQCLLSGASAAPTWGSCSGAAAVSSVTAANTTLTISPTTGAVVAALNLANANTWTAAQTFTNGDLLLKGSSSGAMTLEAPAVASTFIMTFPAATDTVAVLGTAQTFTAAQTFTNSDILLLGSSTGATTFTSANASATNYTLTIPAATTTLAVLGAVNQTFTATNTFNGSVVIGTTGSFAIDGSSSGTVTLATQAAAGTWNFNLPITAGTAGQVLTSQGGVSTAMTWANDVSSFGGVTGAITLGPWLAMTGQQLRYGIHSSAYSTVSDAKLYQPNVSVTSGMNAFTFSAGTFSAGTDIGKPITIQGAGAAGANLVTTIAGVSSATAITTTANAGSTLITSAKWVVYGTDNATALGNWITACQTSPLEPCYLDSGNFGVASALSIGNPGITIIGTNKSQAIIYALSPTIDIIDVNTQNPIQAYSFGLWGFPAATAGNLFHLVGPSTSNELSTIKDMDFQYGWTQLAFADAGWWFVTENVFTNVVSQGVLWSVPSFPNGLDSVFANNFMFENVGSTCFVHTSGGGLKATGNKLLGCTNGYAFTGSGAAFATSDVIWDGNSIEVQAGGEGFGFTKGTATSFSNIHLTNNQVGFASVCFNLNDANTGWLLDIVISGNICNTAASGTGVTVVAAADIVIGPNTWSAVSGGAGISIGANATQVTVAPDQNFGTGITTPITYSATSNIPVVSSCGSGPIKAGNSTDSDGFVTEGSSATGCSVTFGTSKIVTPFCVVAPIRTPAGYSYTTSQVGFVLVHSADMTAFTWHCTQPGTMAIQ